MPDSLRFYDLLRLEKEFFVVLFHKTKELMSQKRINVTDKKNNINNNVFIYY